MIIIIMGVAGAGKTTIGKLLAQELQWQFEDADDFHPAANIAKMQSGSPLTDADRAPWLQALRQAIAQWLQQHENVVLACSALKASYRQILQIDLQQVKLVYLQGSLETIAERLAQRENHFMGKEMLNSQFAALEEPAPEEAIIVDINQTADAIAQQIYQQIQVFNIAVSNSVQ